nr:hypothetical protein [Tanacetum cinerariifolium]
MTACLNELSYIPLNNEQNDPTQGDIGETSNDPTQAKRNEFEKLYASANEELYPDCDYMTRLDFMAKFTYFKVKGKLTDFIFNEMLVSFQKVFPIAKGYKLPLSYYEIKKTFKMTELGYESIHACVNDCFLFRGDANKEVHFCPSNHTSKEMTWHATGKCMDPGKMQHPVDGRAWKNFDTKYSDFVKEPRNVRLGLAADGFNPFGNLSRSYNMWPVILTTCNLPPWLCMKESSFMLTFLIPGPKFSGKDIDVYLRPLIDDLKDLWSKPSVEAIDVATRQKFNMRAMVLWTINDFHARRKTTYVGHIRFLKKPHKWRRSLEFNGEKEDEDPLREFGRDQIQAQLARLPTRVKGKHPKHRQGKTRLEKASIRSGLWLGQNKNDKCSKPQASYSFTPEDRKKFSKPKGSIAEGYVAEEALTFSSYYFWDVTTKFNRPDRNVDCPPPTCQFQVFKSLCKSIYLRSVIRIDHQELKKVIWYVLHNSPKIDTYRAKFKSEFPNKDMKEEFRGWFIVQSRDECRTTQNSGICSPGPNEEMYYENDPDVIHVDKSSDLALSTSLNDLKIAALHIDGQSIDVDTPPDIIDVDEDNDIIDEEDPIPYDLADSDDEDIVNLDIDDGVSVVYSNVARGHDGDGGGDDRPPPYQIPTGCGGCLGKGTRKPNFGARRADKMHTRQETRNLGLKAITDKNGPVPIWFEFGDRETLIPLGDHAAHWANYLGELNPIVGQKSASIQQHLQKIYNGKKVALKERYWVPDEDGTYDVECIRRERPSHIFEVDWDAQIAFWNDPKNLARNAQNKKT